MLYINSEFTALTKLASVQEGDGLGTSCLSAITSQWQVSIDGVFTMGPVDANQNSIGLGALLNGDYTNIYLGDFNGNGNTDILREEKGSWAVDSFMMNQVFHSNGDGTFTMGPVDANQNSIGLGALLNGDYTNIYLGDFNDV